MAKLVILRGEYNTTETLRNVLNYVSDKSKARGYIGAQNMLVDNSFEQIMTVNRYFHSTTQKTVLHFILTFADYEYINPNEAAYIGYRICSLLPEYQIKFGVHQDTEHMHIHFAMSPTSLTDGHKFYFDNTNLYNFISGLRAILEPYEFNVNYTYADTRNESMFPEWL